MLTMQIIFSKFLLFTPGFTVLLFKLKRKIVTVGGPGSGVNSLTKVALPVWVQPVPGTGAGREAEAYRIFRYSLPATGTHIGQRFKTHGALPALTGHQPLREGQKLFQGKDSSEAQHTGQEAHFLRSIAKKLPCLPE